MRSLDVRLSDGLFGHRCEKREAAGAEGWGKYLEPQKINLQCAAGPYRRFLSLPYGKEALMPNPSACTYMAFALTVWPFSADTCSPGRFGNTSLSLCRRAGDYTHQRSTEKLSPSTLTGPKSPTRATRPANTQRCLALDKARDAKGRRVL